MYGVYLLVTSAVSWNYIINARSSWNMYNMKLVKSPLLILYTACIYRVYFDVCTVHLVQFIIQTNHCIFVGLYYILYRVYLCVFLFLQLILEHCEIPIKSVELQLVRVETCGCAEGYARDGKQKNFLVFISMH